MINKYNFNYIFNYIIHPLTLTNKNYFNNIINSLSEPIKPHPTQCCGCGCTDCVWISYYKEVKEYNDLKEYIELKNKK